MKTIGLILCNVAVALGILVGRAEYLHEREERRRLEAQRPEDSTAARDAASSEEVRRPASRRTARAVASITDDMLVRPAGDSDATGESDAREDSAGGPRNPGREPAPGGEAFVPSARLKARFDAANDALARLDFQGAEEQALAIAEDPNEGKGTAAREKALQLAAKARAFRRVLGRALGGPPAPAALAPRTKATIAQVLLANGSRFEAQLVEERPDRYVFKIGTGGTFSPRREDVVELARVEKEVSAGPDWNELQPKIAALDHPVDIFVDGVERCFRLGLKKEGVQLLEKLLARPDSDEVPLLFAADADASLLSDWQIAAGRKRATEGQGDPRAPAASPPGSAVAGSAAPAEQEALLEAQRLVEEARGLYQAAVGKEGKGDDLRQAREKLQAARKVIEQLPETEEAVRTLRQTLAQLLSDVARVSPF